MKGFQSFTRVFPQKEFPNHDVGIFLYFFGSIYAHIFVSVYPSIRAYKRGCFTRVISYNKTEKMRGGVVNRIALATANGILNIDLRTVYFCGNKFSHFHISQLHIVMPRLSSCDYYS